MSRLRIVTSSIVLGALLSYALPSEAIPVFARKYGYNCTMCHSAFPRLNDYGLRYRQNGYQLPGRENEDINVLQAQAPFAGRTSVGYNYDRIRNVPGETSVNQFQANGLDILSGGLFRRNVGYFMIYTPEIRGSRGIVPQDGNLEMANVVFSNLRSTWLNIRVGQFEPEYLPISAKRSLTYSPYEIYAFAFPSGLPLSDTQSGLELYGYGPGGFKYAAGWVNGSNSNRSDDSPADFYLRGVKIFGQGEGQTVGQRLGVLGYFGRARPDPTFPVTTRQSFNRIGLDASLNYRQLNLSLVWMKGTDDAALWNAASDVDFTGGFAELIYQPAFDLVMFTRWDAVNPDNASGIDDIKRWTLGGRYYLYENISLHMEYSYAKQRNPAGPDETEKFFTTRIDFAF
ncbi:MAG: hypothetical protein ACP5R5_03370 [Armatimonadota bacterium]